MTQLTPIVRDLPETHVIATLEALKVFADPLRQHILETLFDGARTVKQIAADLNMAPTKLYYHINLMEEHGLLRVTDTRIVSGIIEKQYDVSASGYLIKRSLLAPGQTDDDGGLDTAIDALIEPLRADMRNSIATGLVDLTLEPADNHRFKINRSVWSMKPERADAFYARLNSLLEEFTGEDDEGEDAGNYSMVLFFYPTASQRPSRRRR
ncbi:MAG: helix-turn-helix domain-containing protein [Chloroflexota bacterium]|nr:helix-turn-helix domain-containing protein [Chloroflexota bacterium]